MDKYEIKIVLVLASIVACVVGSIISLLFFKNKQRLLLQSLQNASQKQVWFGNIPHQALTVGAVFGEVLVMPFVFREVLRIEGIFEELVTLDIITGIVFIFMLLTWCVLCKVLLEKTPIHVITDDTLIISQYMGFGKTEKYPIKELRRKERMERYSTENPTVTLRITVYYENTCVYVVCPEFDGNKKKDLLLELLRQIPEKQE